MKKSLPVPALRGMNSTARTSKFAVDDRAVGERPAGRALQAVDARHDVERQRRVVLQHRAGLEAVAELLPRRRRRRRRRVDRRADDEPVPLIVVGPAPVLHHVGRIGRRAEERLAEVVHRLRQRVGDAHRRPVAAAAAGRSRAGRGSSTSPAPLVLAVVHVGRHRPAAVVGARRDARRHVLVDRHQQVLAAEVLIADA